MTTDRFYGSARWRSLRDRFRRTHPLCRCGRPGKIVDHVKPRSERPDLALEWSNLETLCAQCHGEKSGADKRGEVFQVRYGCDVDGNPLSADHPWNQAKSPAERVWLERKARQMARQEPKPKDKRKEPGSLAGWKPVC